MRSNTENCFPALELRWARFELTGLVLRHGTEWKTDRATSLCGQMTIYCSSWRQSQTQMNTDDEGMHFITLQMNANITSCCADKRVSYVNLISENLT